MSVEDRDEIVLLIDGLAVEAAREEAEPARLAGFALDLLKRALCDLNRIADAVGPPDFRVAAKPLSEQRFGGG